MEFQNAEALAREKMNEHGLNDWGFEFSHTKRILGQCDRKRRAILLSKNFVRLNPEEKVLNTILHEIAHALTRGGHNAEWRRVAIRIGCDGHRCSKAEMPKGRYTLSCEHCGSEFSRHRKPRSGYACAICCKKYNGGRYLEKYKLTLTSQ